MCGICGSINFDLKPIEEKESEQINNFLLFALSASFI